jgi:hypothetical protein
MRNPFERIWSNARMKGNPPADLVTFSEQPAVRARTDYRATVELLTSTVPKEQLHFAFYEELSDATEGPKHLNELFTHLGLSPFVVPDEVNRNFEGAGPKTALDPAVRREIVRRVRPSYEFAREFMGRLPSKWERDLTEG